VATISAVNFSVIAERLVATISAVNFSVIAERLVRTISAVNFSVIGQRLVATISAVNFSVIAEKHVIIQSTQESIMLPTPKHKKLKVYKYQLIEQYSLTLPSLEGYKFDHKWIKSDGKGKFTMKKGAKSDGASGVAIDTDTFILGFWVHDMLYLAGREEFIPYSMRAWTDQVLYTLCRNQGMNYFRAQYIYRAVRIGGKDSFTPGYEL